MMKQKQKGNRYEMASFVFCSWPGKSSILHVIINDYAVHGFLNPACLWRLANC